MRPRPSPLRPLVLAALGVVALLVSGCELRVAVDVVVERDGSGTVELAVELDEELTRILADAGADPLAGLDDLRQAAGSWEVVDVREAGGAGVRLRAAFDDPDGLARLVGELHAGLDEEDPRILEGLRLERRRDGSLALYGRAGLVLPTSPGVRGEGVDLDEEEVERLLGEHADDLVAYDLRVVFPVEVERHDGDVAPDERAVVWHLPVGEMRTVMAESASPGWPTSVVAASVAVVAALAAGIVVYVMRRARQRGA